MYQLRPPHPELAPYVEHLWFVTADEGPVDLQVDVFVDLRADLIFNFGAPYERSVLRARPARGAAATAPPSTAPTSIATSNLDAQRLQPIRIRQRGEVRVYGVRFRLGGLGAFDVPSLKAFTGATPAPRALFGPSADRVEHMLRRAHEVDEAAQQLDTWLRGALRPDRPGYARVVESLARQDAPDRPVAASTLAAHAGLSLRALERDYARYVGVGPATVARVLRFQRAMRALMRPLEVPLAHVAAGCGYFDQAHFVHDFRAMTGDVPRSYRGYFPAEGPSDFAPNLVAFVQDGR